MSSGEAFRLGRQGGRRLRNLRHRATILAAIRRFFAERDFLEVETPLLIARPAVEPQLDYFAGIDRHGQRHGWLATSPELQMKRLLVGLSALEPGRPVRLYQLTRSFRHDEIGSHHDREFTLLEWYRTGDGYQALMDDLVELVRACADAVDGQRQRTYQGQPLDLDRVERISVSEAMQRHAGVDVAALAGLEEADWSEAFFRPFVEKVEPALGRGQLTLLDRWPARLAALARRCPDDPTVAERFEAFAGGLELCNAFGELCDPEEQRQRFVADLAERRRQGRPPCAEDDLDRRFLQALDEGLPPSAGIAVGVDRLVMLLCDARELREVVAFSSDEL